jgi:hypothetical protein
MVDPVSLSASIASLLQVASTVVKCINGMKDAPAELKRLMIEVSSTRGILSDLNGLVHSSKTVLVAVQSLNGPGGPLEQLRSSLELLDRKLTPVVGLNAVGTALAWPFRKGEIRDVLCAIERHKTLFSLALQNDHL